MAAAAEAGKVAMAILTNKWTWIIIAAIIIAFIIVPRFYTSAKLSLQNAATPEPTPIDYANAEKMVNTKGVWNDDEDEMIAITKQYNKTSYPILRKAYFKISNGGDLDKFLKDELDSSQYAQIALIVG